MNYQWIVDRLKMSISEANSKWGWWRGELDFSEIWTLSSKNKKYKNL